MELFLATALVLSVVIYLTQRYFKLNKSIKGKLALVTGGGNGLGRGLCLQLAKNGCNVIIADVDILKANETAEEIKKLGVQSKAYKVDVTNFSEIKELKVSISKEFGDVDILINNAGLISYSTIFGESESFINKMVQVNLTGVILMTRCFLEEMIKRQSGHIVTVSSLAGLYHHPYGVSYCATKFGATGFMMGIREYIRVLKLDRKIFSTTIMPDVIATRDDVVKSVSKR